MASNRRRSLRKLNNYVNRIDRRVKKMSRKPAPTRIADRTVTTEIIDVSAVTTVELADGAVTYEVLDSTISTDISDAVSDASTALSTANGKNKVYRQASQPTGGTYADGDLWFDTDDDNKIYRYASSTSTWVGFTLGDNALASISAVKITAGSLDANVIVTSNLDAGQITVGTLTGIEVIATQGSIGQWDIRADGIESPNGNIYLYSDSGGAASIVVGTGVNNQVVLSDSGSIYTSYSGTDTLINNPDNAWTIYIDANWTNGSGKMGPNGFAAANVASPGQFALMWYDNVTFSSATSFDVFGEPSIYYAGIRYPGASFGPGNNNAMALQWTGSDAFVVIDNVAGQYLGGAVFSDRRYKRNIAPPEQAWIDKILNDVKVWQFNRINPLDDEDLHLYPLEIGVIADEYKQAFPQWESSNLLADPNGADADVIRSVNYTGLIPGLVLIAQKFNADIALLEQRVAALEA